MHLRLIPWFFIILNFMEYIGSQHASRGRRQRRSKCGLFTRLLPPAAFTCRVARPGGDGARRGDPPAPRPAPPTEVTVAAPVWTVSLPPSSPRPSVTPRTRACRSPSGASRVLMSLPPPCNFGFSGKFGPSFEQLQGFMLFFRDSDGGPRIPGMPLTTEETSGEVRSPWRPVTSRRHLAWGGLAGLHRGAGLPRARGAARGPWTERLRGRCPSPRARVEPEAGEALGSAGPRAPEPLAAPAPGREDLGTGR